MDTFKIVELGRVSEETQGFGSSFETGGGQIPL